MFDGFLFLWRGFMELVRGQIATAITTARAYEQERMKAEALKEVGNFPMQLGF